MSTDDQILKLQEFSIVFLSKTCIVFTKDLDRTLRVENLIPLTTSGKFKKTKSSIGLMDFNVKSKGNSVYISVKDKRFTLKDLIKHSQNFEDINLLTSSKFIMYKKGVNYYVALPRGNYTYLNRGNVIQKRDLSNVIYFRDKNKEEFLKIQKVLTSLNIPLSYYIFDNKLSEEVIDNVTYTNDLSPTNAFYFIDDNAIKITNTGAKPILTYGFSRNNSLNYFDINMSSTFGELKQYINSDLNYNKNHFNKADRSITDIEVVLRCIQFNLFLPISFYDIKEMELIPFDSSNYYYNVALKYLKLRVALTPFLYSAFKESRINGSNIYLNKNNQIFFNRYLMFIPIFSFVEPATKQYYLKIFLDDIYYDFETGEKYCSNTSNFYSLLDMPIFVKTGGIIPLILEKDKKDEFYEIRIYPGANSTYKLHYDEYVSEGIVKHAYSDIELEFKECSMRIIIKPESLIEFLPNKFIVKLINLKSDCNISVDGSDYSIEYNNENKQVVIEVLDTNNIIKIDISNPLGLEVDRSNEFYYKKIDEFFYNSNLEEKDLQTYKYKVRPYLHENLVSIDSRVHKHIKFLNKKQIKNLIQMISLYKK